MNKVHNRFNLGPDLSSGPEGVDRALLSHCLNLLPPSYVDNGWAVEFGTGSGDTTRMIARVMPVISFDSFKGLPEDWRPGYPAGSFSEWEMPTDIPGATIVPGWFEDTVPDYEWPEWLALVHVDCDLYSSTKTALDSIGPHLQVGTIIVFDEFHGFDGASDHEARAWREFADAHPLTWDVIGHGREQVAFRIRSLDA